MPSILLVKTSSLGDVVHNLPVVADIRAALGDMTIDWVVERAFAAIPAMHPGVRKVIPCELRRWRRSWMSADTRADWQRFVADLRAVAYDAIVDTQGLLKSAIVARVAHGRRHGLDWRSSREPLRFLYDCVYAVPWGMHAVERNRRLCGLALGYEVRGPAEYGIRAAPGELSWMPPDPFVVLLHATSHPSKLWPEERWIELGRRCRAAGRLSVLPWGSADERVRAERLAAAVPGAIVPERLDLHELARVLSAAAAVVGVDTGLTHLAAALGVPVVGIYGVTDPAATGLFSTGPTCNLGRRGAFPEVTEVLSALDRLGAGAGPAVGVAS